jgi:hypothetical protein
MESTWDGPGSRHGPERLPSSAVMSGGIPFEQLLCLRARCSERTVAGHRDVGIRRRASSCCSSSLCPCSTMAHRSSAPSASCRQPRASRAKRERGAWPVDRRARAVDPGHHLGDDHPVARRIALRLGDRSVAPALATPGARLVWRRSHHMWPERVEQSMDDYSAVPV